MGPGKGASPQGGLDTHREGGQGSWSDSLQQEDRGRSPRAAVLAGFALISATNRIPSSGQVSSIVLARGGGKGVNKDNDK